GRFGRFRELISTSGKMKSKQVVAGALRMNVIQALIFSLLLATTSLSQSGLESKSSQEVAAKLPPPKVAVDAPLDSPLRVSAWTSWTNAKLPGIELDIEVKNVSEKAVRA